MTTNTVQVIVPTEHTLTAARYPVTCSENCRSAAVQALQGGIIRGWNEERTRYRAMGIRTFPSEITPNYYYYYSNVVITANDINLGLRLAGVILRLTNGRNGGECPGRNVWGKITDTP